MSFCKIWVVSDKLIFLFEIILKNFKVGYAYGKPKIHHNGYDFYN